MSAHKCVQSSLVLLAGCAWTAIAALSQQPTATNAAPLYQESGRPAFHFTVKRGWSNDANGPIFFNGQYHLFWQSYPFGNRPDGGRMQWDHAVGNDLVHWREMPPALLPDKLGAVWSGTSVIDRENVAGFGKNAFVIFYTAFDPATHKQVQCIAYSTDNGATFQRYSGNPVLDTGAEVGSNDTRDPKVFWYEPTRRWIMVLFEKDGMSIFNSTDLKHWTRRSHLTNFWECPDLFELPVDGNSHNKKWVIHGGSASYQIGSFDGEKFTPETPELRYAEGKNQHGDDVLYAAQSFENMPGDRRVQMAWGRIEDKGMPFTQMLLFPTEFKLVTTSAGIRLVAFPVKEIELLHSRKHVWANLSAEAANRQLTALANRPLDGRLVAQLDAGDQLEIMYGSQSLATIPAKDVAASEVKVEILIDKTVAEVFVDGGARYILSDLTANTGDRALHLKVGHGASKLKQLEIYEMKSMWEGQF
jgi:sucrose-6-phosphate hydrolase SacC (GH32 family)